MKNYEKYADEIREYKGDTFCVDFVKPYILKSDHCESDCTKCRMLQAIWLMEDYEEPEVDWSKVEVNTPILVSDIYREQWFKRYFAEYKGGVVYAWHSGRTSWTEDCMVEWAHAKLAEDEKECKEPETDWSKVNVDTLILVKNCEDEEWKKRYFAEYENGIIRAWDSGRTSWSAKYATAWKFAKLAETEGTE